METDKLLKKLLESRQTHGYITIQTWLYHKSIFSEPKIGI